MHLQLVTVILVPLLSAPRELLALDIQDFPKIPDDIEDRIPDDFPIPNIPDIPEGWTLPPNLFPNLTVSMPCQKALAEMFSEGRSADATLALDACGKTQPGFLIGNLAWLGHYPECSSLKPDFHFCTTSLKLNVTSAIFPILKWGLCLPSECDEADVAGSLSQLIDNLQYDELKALNPQVTRTVCATDPPREYDAGFYATVVLCCVVGVLVLSGGILDVYQQRRKEENTQASSETLPLLHHQKQNGVAHSTEMNEQPKQNRPSCLSRFILCFSFTRTMEQLMSTRTRKGDMLCLNGIRVISMTWVILGHTGMLLYATFGPSWDGIYLIGRLKNFAMQGVSNGFPAVDTFFLLSGLLLTYISLGRMARTEGRVSWPMFYFHRYWRLLPALGFAMLFTLYLRPYFGEGPLWSSAARYNFHCEEYWWTNLLYINNFYPKNASSGCIYWAWYLANDMQFYLISPVILIALYRKPGVGLAILTLLGVASIATTIALMIVNDFKVALMGALDMGHSNGDDVFSVVYVKPYCRIVPYLIGIALGYAFHRRRGKKVRMHRLVAIGGWLAAAATGLAVVYGLQGEFNGKPLTTVENALYMAFAHLGWACAMAWVIFACVSGYGGWINDFLSWKAWLPLCRMTYSAYLFHPLVMQILTGNTASALNSNAVFMSYYFVGSCVFSFAIAFLVNVRLELPFANLEQFLK
ncbi:nose resistant to fluoxetine protein 6-like [Diadema antillarum]|uniref:nose resistant to fluoxetine protein 6-like n=1 Tax=Diadema antillarum TaxID=105358 RepID=UPI003A83DEE6